jgi:small subunit ribosomal protein S9
MPKKNIETKVIDKTDGKKPSKAAIKKASEPSPKTYSTGKRKNSVAKVWIKKGSGEITINGRKAKIYLGREILFNIVNHPFDAIKSEKKFDVIAQVNGGGLSGQAGALAHGISKALVKFDENNHKILRASGFLTRDSRVVERKKYGLKKARKAQTYRKR